MVESLPSKQKTTGSIPASRSMLDGIEFAIGYLRLSPPEADKLRMAARRLLDAEADIVQRLG